MISRLPDVDLKLERAEEHFKAVKKIADDYFAQEFDPMRVELDSQGKGWVSHRLPPTSPKLPA